MKIQDDTLSAIVGEGAGSTSSVCFQPRPVNQTGQGGGTWMGYTTGTFPSGAGTGTLFTYFMNTFQDNSIITINRMNAYHIQNAAPTLGANAEQMFDFLTADLQPRSAGNASFGNNMRTRNMPPTIQENDVAGATITSRQEVVAVFPVLIQGTKPLGLNAVTPVFKVIGEDLGIPPVQIQNGQYFEITTRFTLPAGANVSKLVLNWTISRLFEY